MYWQKVEPSWEQISISNDLDRKIYELSWEALKYVVKKKSPFWKGPQPKPQGGDRYYCTGKSGNRSEHSKYGRL